MRRWELGAVAHMRRRPLHDSLAPNFERNVATINNLDNHIVPRLYVNDSTVPHVAGETRSRMDGPDFGKIQADAAAMSWDPSA